jgi:hypothetical protein
MSHYAGAEQLCRIDAMTLMHRNGGAGALEQGAEPYIVCRYGTLLDGKTR